MDGVLAEQGLGQRGSMELEATTNSMVIRKERARDERRLLSRSSLILCQATRMGLAPRAARQQMMASVSHHARPADFRGRVEAACHITVPILNAKARSAMAKKIGLGLQNHSGQRYQDALVKTIADRTSYRTLGDRGPGLSQFAYASSWRGKSAAASSQQEDDQDNQQDGAQAASDIRAAIVEATTAEQDQQDDD